MISPLARTKMRESRRERDLPESSGQQSVESTEHRAPSSRALGSLLPLGSFLALGPCERRWPVGSSRGSSSTPAIGALTYPLPSIFLVYDRASSVYNKYVSQSVCASLCVCVRVYFLY